MARHYDLLPRPLYATLLDACQRYYWPGNLRELENLVKRYLVMGDESATLAELEAKPTGTWKRPYGRKLAKKRTVWQTETATTEILAALRRWA